MKNFILMVMMCFCTVCSFAQNRLTDNVNLTIQGGTITTFDNFYSGHTAMAPIAVIGLDKYITPAIGVGVDARTLIGTGSGSYNTHTAFDNINLSGYGKVKILNLDGNTKVHVFDPVVYAGVGWGHGTTSKHTNYMTFRTGTELNFNLNKKSAIVVNPSVVWYDINNGRLNKHNGNFELTVGYVHHFNSGWKKHKCPESKIITKDVIRERVVTNYVQNTFVITFPHNSVELGESQKRILNYIKGSVTIEAYASPEGNVNYNKELSQRRANVIRNYLINNGVTVTSAVGKGASDKASNRIAIITVH